MAKCCFAHGSGCDAIATTILRRNNGEIGQLCELHYNLIINLCKGVAAGKIRVDSDDAEAKANHWLVKNKIPS